MNKCKCCNSALGAVASHLIFDEAGKQRNIAFLLFDYIGRRVIERDGDRQAVCENCLRQLIQCYEFKQKCMRANADDDSEDDVDEELESKGIIEQESDDAENLVTETEQTAAESEYEFDRYAEIIEECDDEDVDGDESNGATNTEQTPPAENEYKFLNDLCGFKLTNVISDDEERSPFAADIEYLDMEVEDEGDYEYAGMGSPPELRNEVIELTEYALDTTSKTVKTIGKFIFDFVYHDVKVKPIFFHNARYGRRFASHKGKTETRCSTAYDRIESNDEIDRTNFGCGENCHF